MTRPLNKVSARAISEKTIFFCSNPCQLLNAYIENFET